MSFVGGSLSLKGGDSGVKKKKKKSKDGKVSIPDKDVAKAPANTETATKDAGKPEVVPPVSHKTKAQLQHDAYVAKREAEILKKAGVKSHRERITEYNNKLSEMTEHNDIPKNPTYTHRSRYK